MGSVNKLLLELDKPLLLHTLDAFERHSDIGEIILVVSAKDRHEIEKLCSGCKKIASIVLGGSTRQESSCLGVQKASGNIILIHDAARPFVSSQIISNSIKDAAEHGASAVAVQAKDTIRLASDGIIQQILPRDQLWHMQTPQAFQADIIRKAHEHAVKIHLHATDDASLVEPLGYKVKLTQGSYGNIKITTNDDIGKAHHIMAEKVRIGIGQDSHRYVNGRQMVLAGITLPFEYGFKANSDGDIILHALFNALSSSVGGRSISQYADELCKKGITDSKEYIKIAVNLVKTAGYKINNISVSIEAKQPKLEKHIPSMVESLASLLDIDKKQVGITATTGEDLTDFGRGLGMQALARVSVIQDDS